MVQFIREKKTATDDWVTDRAPTMADTCDDARQCVEVTYVGGSVGWESWSSLWQWNRPCKGQSWDATGSYVIAWRRIRPAYRPEGDR